VYVLKMISRLTANVRKTAKELNKMREQAPTKPKSTEMIRCAACGAFVVPRDAVQVTSGGRGQMFCSYECVQTRAKTV
jgi:alpha-D-ribose 1-methylphosphonate 5-triphosphate synthase subunit PhnG